MTSFSGIQSSATLQVVYGALGRSVRTASIDPMTGALAPLGAIENLPGDAHYGAMHPTRKYLYLSVSDRAQANLIYGFGVEGQTGLLTRLGEPFMLPPGLSRAVHITVDGTGRYLLMAHNVTESVAVLALQHNGRLGSLVSQPAMPKLGFLVHQIRIDPANRWVFVPVRGNDAQPAAQPPVPEQTGRLHLFSFDDGVLRQQQTIEYESGIGPRHLDFHPTEPFLYLLAERGNVLITYRRDGARLTELYRTTTLKDPEFKFPAQRAGAIHLHPNGKWLYVTNRNVVPCPASAPCPDRQATPFVAGENNVALFTIDAFTGRPTLVDHTDSRGFEPRTFTFDADANFVITANMMNIARTGTGGKIVDVKPNMSVFRIGADGQLQFVRSDDQAGGGQLWWVGAYRAGDGR